MALLLAVQLLCVISGAFASDHNGDDVHHLLWTSSAEQTQATSSGQTAVTDISHHTACDHCSHCHATHHIGLYKNIAALPPVHGEQPVFLLEPVPASPNLSIYRPPIS